MAERPGRAGKRAESTRKGRWVVASSSRAAHLWKDEALPRPGADEQDFHVVGRGLHAGRPAEGDCAVRGVRVVGRERDTGKRWAAPPHPRCAPLLFRALSLSPALTRLPGGRHCGSAGARGPVARRRGRVHPAGSVACWAIKWLGRQGERRKIERGACPRLTLVCRHRLKRTADPRTRPALTPPWPHRASLSPKHALSTSLLGECMHACVGSQPWAPLLESAPSPPGRAGAPLLLSSLSPPPRAARPPLLVTSLSPCAVDA